MLHESCGVGLMELTKGGQNEDSFKKRMAVAGVQVSWHDSAQEIAAGIERNMSNEIGRIYFGSISCVHFSGRTYFAGMKM